MGVHCGVRQLYRSPRYTEISFTKALSHQRRRTGYKIAGVPLREFRPFASGRYFPQALRPVPLLWEECHGPSDRKGGERYNRLTTNGTKVIAKDGTECSEVKDAGSYIFECSEKLAKVYFPQFLGETEILKPRDLRLWFKEQFESAAKIYSGNN